tara:strand:+ start:170 stop:1474 length:1305 start_codon:yes stop_codon:yes gene_type:complete
MSTIKVNTVTKRTGSTLTLGESGATVTLACGASQTGFGRTGTVNWCTTAKTSPFTAESGKGYFVNTTSGGVTVTLPASPSAGDIVSIKDYLDTFDTNAVTLGRNGSKISGECVDGTLSDEGDSVTLIYVDGTRGWLNVQTDDTIVGAYTVNYLVVAGGGGGGYGTDNGGGGGGAGGFRTGCLSVLPGQSISITVGGAGGAGVAPCSPGVSAQGCSGSNSVFSTITSAGGGGAGGAAPATYRVGLNGGSGGGGAGEGDGAGGTGNTPPVAPPQGSDGGTGENAAGSDRGGGGGGAAAVGTPGVEPSRGDGGIGAPYGNLGPLAPSYGTTGPAPGRYFAGGGGAGNGAGNAPSGGSGGGGNGSSQSPSGPGVAGSTNTGGGGGGGVAPSYNNGYSGGSGIVVLRHATAKGGSGGNATATCGSDTIRVFTSDGTFSS